MTWLLCSKTLSNTTPTVQEGPHLCEVLRPLVRPLPGDGARVGRAGGVNEGEGSAWSWSDGWWSRLCWQCPALPEGGSWLLPHHKALPLWRLCGGLCVRQSLLQDEEISGWKTDRCDSYSLLFFSSVSTLDDSNMPTDSIGTVTLDDFTFKKFVEKNKFVVVKYFVPGCQHCVDFKDVFDELVMTFLMEESEDIQFAEVNCMDMESLDTCIEESVNGFPSVYLYKVWFVVCCCWGKKQSLSPGRAPGGFIFWGANCQETGKFCLGISRPQQGRGGVRSVHESDGWQI